MVLGEHEAFELGPEVAGDASRQRRHDRLAGRHQPALAPIEHCRRLHDQVLDGELLVALEAGAGRNVLGLDDLGLGDGQPAALGPAPADLALALGCGPGLRRLLHAARHDLGPALQALQPRNLVTQLGILCLQPSIVLQNLHQQRLQLFEAKPIDDPR
jgi:hypothetical protein